MILWLIKLPFRIVLIPVLLFVCLVAVVIKILAGVGHFAGGLLMLLITGGICFSIWHLQWINLFLLVIVGMAVMAALLCAAIVESVLDGLCSAIASFIFS